MKNICINIAGKLPRGVIEIYKDICFHASKLSIDFIVVGATARDLVLVYGYGSTIERGTRDIDFGINVSSWADFNSLTDGLIHAGYTADSRIKHRLSYNDSDGLTWEIDIVPFGEIADINKNISWPSHKGVVMSVLGFAEAFDHSMSVVINEEPNITLKVPSPAGMSILKLVAWLDRPVEKRAKDAGDFRYLTQSYINIPEVANAIYDDGYMESVDWDQDKACIKKLGHDAGTIALPATKTYLEKNLFQNTHRREDLARDIQKSSGKGLPSCIEMLKLFELGFFS